MNEENIWEEYTLSQSSKDRLRAIKESLKENITLADPSWAMIGVKETEEETYSEEESADEKEEDVANDNLSETFDDTKFASTQFYFTQVEKDFPKDIAAPISREKSDTVECLYESLERPNGKLDFSLLDCLSEDEVFEVISDLEKRLSVTGTYNLCCSMNTMSFGERIKYTETLYSHLLLPKIIVVEEPSRLLLTVIAECVKKFADDVQQFIFVPLLNVDLKDTTIVNSITTAFGQERNPSLITDFLATVKELKSWHIPILQNLVSFKIDQKTNDKLIKLFSEKSLDFAKDKNFGKLLLSYIKVQGHFLEEQKISLWEIISLNQSFFKKPLENILKNM